MRRPLLLWLTALVTSCGGSDTTAPPKVAPVESITFRTGTGGSLLPVATALQLQLFLRDANHNLLTDRRMTFTTSDATRAAVDEKGLVFGLAPGNVTITAVSEGKRGEIALQVVAPELCRPNLAASCNGSEAYLLLLVDDQPLPVRSPYGVGEWDYDEDAGTWRLTAAMLLLNIDGGFANVVTHRAASGATDSHTWAGRYTRLTSSSVRFVEGSSTYRGELVGDRLIMTFANGRTFTWQAYQFAAGRMPLALPTR